MENKTVVASWLIDNKDKLSLKVRKLTWIDEWLPGLSDFQVRIEFQGQQFSGRGIAESENGAIEKAGAEAIERLVAKFNETKTAAIAVHITDDLAMQNARFEAIERDRFFCHYLTKTPFQDRDLSSDESAVRIKTKLSESGVGFKLFEMIELGGIRSVIAIASGDLSGMVIGLGASESFHVAKDKAIRECLMNSVAAMSGQVAPMSIKEFAEGRAEPIDHRRLYLGEKSLRLENSWMLDGVSSHGREESPDSIDFEYRKLDMSHAVLNGCPLVAYACSSPNLQAGFFGNNGKEHLNMSRMAGFLAVESIDEGDLNQLPHPLG